MTTPAMTDLDRELFDVWFDSEFPVNEMEMRSQYDTADMLTLMRSAFSAGRAALPQQVVAAGSIDSEEDAYLIDRLSKLLAGVAVALNGPEPALTRWSYHDLPEKAAKLMLELELYRQPAPVSAGAADKPVVLTDDAILTIGLKYGCGDGLGPSRKLKADDARAKRLIAIVRECLAGPARAADVATGGAVAKPFMCDDGAACGMGGYCITCPHVPAQQQAATVPDGFVLVPVEPTKAMVKAGFKAFKDTWHGEDYMDDWRACYRAMVAAATTDGRES